MLASADVQGAAYPAVTFNRSTPNTNVNIAVIRFFPIFPIPPDKSILNIIPQNKELHKLDLCKQKY
jgi:hypothetical protein